VSEERFVLAFYGLNPSPKVGEDFFLTAGQWFSELGYPPDKMSVSGKGHSGKVGDYRRATSKLQKTGFSEVESFSMYASKPNAFIEEFFASAFFAHADRHGGDAVVAVPSSLIARETWLPVARKIIENVRPAYGIGFKRELGLGPVWYALGVCYGGDPVPTGEAYEEERNISRWCDMGRVKQVYREGLLRDVYPWNFLTQTQLTKEVGGVLLEQWIRQDARRGTLSPLCDGVSLWEVGEAHLPAVRQALHQAGTIFDWRKYP